MLLMSVGGMSPIARCLQERVAEARLEVGDFSEHNNNDMAWNHNFDDELSGEQMIGDDYMDGNSNNDNDLPSSFSKYFRPGFRMYV
jgi:hypothetical protein